MAGRPGQMGAIGIPGQPGMVGDSGFPGNPGPQGFEGKRLLSELVPCLSLNKHIPLNILHILLKPSLPPSKYVIPNEHPEQWFSNWGQGPRRGAGGGGGP